jgi:ribosomal protein L37E
MGGYDPTGLRGYDPTAHGLAGIGDVLEVAGKKAASNHTTCERCGNKIGAQRGKRFCGSCSDIRAEERRRASYLSKKASGKTK